MGIRETQIFGLTDDARTFINENANKIVSEYCPNCKHPLRFITESIVYDDATHLGMFDDGPSLNEYTLKDGRKAREVVQASPWSAGPCIFLCLEVNGEKMFEWSKEEIDDA